MEEEGYHYCGLDLDYTWWEKQLKFEWYCKVLWLFILEVHGKIQWHCQAVFQDCIFKFNLVVDLFSEDVDTYQAKFDYF